MLSILDDLISICETIPNFDVVFVDVGSAGGLKSRWSAARKLMSVHSFDPRQDGSKSAETDVIYPFAVAQYKADIPLYVTKFGNMSSNLPPNSLELAKFQKWYALTDVVSVSSIPADNLDSALSNQCIDAIKIDTQGSELNILRGANRLLNAGILFLEVEVSFFQRYVGQALFPDIYAELQRKGYQFIDFFQMRRYYRNNTFGIDGSVGNDQRRSGQLAYADALFLITEERMNERLNKMSSKEQESDVLKLCMILLIYRKTDIAAYYLDLYQAYLSPEVRSRVWRVFSRVTSLSGSANLGNVQ